MSYFESLEYKVLTGIMNGLYFGLVGGMIVMATILLAVIVQFSFFPTTL